MCKNRIIILLSRLLIDPLSIKNRVTGSKSLRLMGQV